MTIEISAEMKKKGIGNIKYLIGFELFILFGGLITGIVFIFRAIFTSDFMPYASSMWIGIYIMAGSMGFALLVIAPTTVIMATRRRKDMFSSLQSFKISAIGPYAPGYKPSGVKKPRFCEYCGFEVLKGERECPECGGPVKTINSSHI